MGTICYYSAPSALVHLALFMRVGGPASVVGFRWAFLKINLQYVFREMSKLLPAVGYISGVLGGGKLPFGAAALRPDGGC